MKKILLLIFVIILPEVAISEKIEKDGIWYNIIRRAKEAEVTYGNWIWYDVNKNDGRYHGNVIIPSSIQYDGQTYVVNSIGKEAFCDCEDLTTVSLPNTIKKIDESAFSLCYKLDNITIPESVESIGYLSFQFCKKLRSITIPNSVTIIENSAFLNCESLLSVKLPEKLQTLGQSVFMNCSNLESINLPQYLTTINDYCFCNCSKLSSLELPSSLMYIGSNAFKECTSLVTLNIPNKVYGIGESAFDGCSRLKTISLGWDVMQIGDKAFQNCKELTDLFCYTERVPNIWNNTFQNSYIEYVTLHVRESVINLFKNVNPWNKFKDIIKLDIPKHTITYILNGEVYLSYEIEEGSTITPENVPQKEGYSFSGWQGLPIRMLYNDITTTGAYLVNQYILTYLIDGMVYKTYNVQYGDSIIPESNPVKEGYIFSGWGEIPETMPASNITISGSFSTFKKCEKPIITLENGQILFTCETDSVEFLSEITDDDIKKYKEATIPLSVTYNITVYATKPGYNSSDVVTAKLCWIDMEPSTEGITNSVINLRSQAVMIQSENGLLTVQGANVGTPICVYDTLGNLVGYTCAVFGVTQVKTSLSNGDIGIVKIGEKTIKVFIR